MWQVSQLDFILAETMNPRLLRELRSNKETARGEILEVVVSVTAPKSFHPSLERLDESTNVQQPLLSTRPSLMNKMTKIYNYARNQSSCSLHLTLSSLSSNWHNSKSTLLTTSCPSVQPSNITAREHNNLNKCGVFTKWHTLSFYHHVESYIIFTTYFFTTNIQYNHVL